VLELAVSKRARFAATSEAMAASQRVLFDEGFEEDAAAITAEIDQYQKLAKPASRASGTESMNSTSGCMLPSASRSNCWISQP
jgi:hypothetical protein